MSAAAAAAASSSSTAALASSAADGGLAASETDAAALTVALAEHRCVANTACQRGEFSGGRRLSDYIPKHVRDLYKADDGAANVALVEVSDAAITTSGGDVLHLNVHVVFDCR